MFKSPSRRAGSVVAGAALGLVGVLSSAMPALACHPQVDNKATTSCVNTDGSWQVNWVVGTTDNDFGDGWVDSVTWNPADLTTSFDGTLKKDAVLSHYKALTATQKLKSEATEATITVVGKWKRGKNGYYTAPLQSAPKVSKPTELCEGQTTPPTSTPPSTAPSSEAPSTAPSSEAPSTAPSSEAPSSAPASSAPASESPSSVPSTTPAENPVATEPQLLYDTTCDTLTVGIEVPADNTEAVTVKFTPNKGDAKTVTAQPGETKTVDFDAAEGLKVTASAEGQEDTTIAYEAPADCDVLALTGSNSSTIAGGAVLVLLVGAGLFFMARRRKIRFTA